MVLIPVPDSFRHDVLAIAGQLYPRAVPDWKLGSDATEVIWGQRVIFLGNLYALIAPLDPAERAERIRDWLKPFDPEIQARVDAAVRATDDWSYAKPLLRPRLQSHVVTNEYGWMVRQPFSSDLVIAYTLDLGDRDVYVSNEKLAGWGVPIDEVHASAIANLEDMSTKLPLKPYRHEGVTGSYILIETGDDYDASRLLLPGFRGRLLDAMGSSLRAGIPGRSLLYVWSPDRRSRARSRIWCVRTSRGSPTLSAPKSSRSMQRA